MAVNFLPICDLLFNFISVASYFCDVAFDIIVIYTLYQSETAWFLVLLVATIVSLFACQILSIKWSFDEQEGQQQGPCRQFTLCSIHVLQLGVMWRYSKLLFAPIEIQLVKREMRNLCLLRMIHGFCQSLFFLLVQGYLFARRTEVLGEVHYVSVALSLFSVCWALASFNKNVRSQNIDRLVLTWIGVIVQLLWRLGTVASRCLALVIYASAHEFWIFLVAFLHWMCMFLWLAIPKTTFQKERVPRSTKIFWSLILSYVYIFCYINVEDTKTKPRIIIFYTVTFIENVLLVVLWTLSVKASLDFEKSERQNVIISVVVLFVTGICFMLLYYQLFHVSKLGTGNPDQVPNGLNCRSSLVPNDKMHSTGNCNQAVFNCALNPAMKKKKLPSVLPPPPPSVVAGKVEVPFWKEPLPQYNNQEEWDSKDIGQKLQVKRESQLKHLQAIETEIRNGRLERPPPQSGPRFRHDLFPPVPSLKRQPYFRTNFEANDSSGDQGDVDSGEELPQPRRTPQFISQRTYETPL